MQGTEWKKLRNLSTEELNALTEEELKQLIVEEYKACEARNLFKFGTSEEKSDTLWFLARYFDGCDKSILEALLEDFLKKPEGRDLFEKLFSLDAAKLKPRVSEGRTYETIDRDNKELIDEVQKYQDQLYKIRYFLAHYQDTITYINLLNDKIRANKAKNVANTAFQESEKQDPEIHISAQQDTTVRVASKKNNSLKAVIGATQKAQLKTFEELSKAIATKLESFDGDERADFEERFQEINRALESNVEITGKILDETILKLEELNQEISSAQGVITDNKYYSEDEILDSFEQRIREKFSNLAPQDVHILQEAEAWIVLQTIADFHHKQKINIDMLLDEVEDEKERDALEAMIFSLNPEALYERGDLTYTAIVKKHAEQIKLVQKHNDLFNKIYFFLKDPEVLQIIEQAKAYATEYGVPNDNAITQPASSSSYSSSQSATLEDFDLDGLLPYPSTQENDKEIKNPSENQPESVIIDGNIGNDPKVSSTTRPNMSEARMRTAAQIFDEAKQSQSVVGTSSAILPDGSYNTGFLLDGRQIHAQALIRLSQKMGISLNEAAKYYIADINLEGGIESRLADEENFNEETQEIETNFKAIYGEQVQKSVEAAKQGKPAFLTIIDGSHSVLLSLIQDKKDANKVHVIYTNSIPADQTGVRFVEHLKNKLSQDGDLSGDSATFASIDQQYDDCCGLSVADNIASIAKHCSENGETDADSIKGSLRSFPGGDAEKKLFYKKKGKALFDALDFDNPDIDFFNTPFVPEQPEHYSEQNINGAEDAENQQEVPQANPRAADQNNTENANPQANNPEAKKDAKKDKKNEVVSPKNHDKEKDSISWKGLGWLTSIYLAIGAFAAPLVPAVVAAVIINVIAAATKLFVGVLDALKSLIEAITSLIKGILDSVRALLQLFGKGIDYVVTKATGKEKLINDVPLEDLPRREKNQPAHEKPRNDQPDGPANERPVNLAGLTVPAAELQPQPQAPNTSTVPPVQPANRAPIIQDLPTQSDRNAANSGVNLTQSETQPAAATARGTTSAQGGDKPVLPIGTIIPGRPTSIFNDGSTIIAGDASSASPAATNSQGEQSKSQNNSNPADKTHASRARSNSNPSEKTNPLDSEKSTIQRRNSNPTLPTREK